MNLVRPSMTGNGHLPIPSMRKTTSSQCHRCPSLGRKDLENRFSMPEYSVIRRSMVLGLTPMPSFPSSIAASRRDMLDVASRSAQVISCGLCCLPLNPGSPEKVRPVQMRSRIKRCRTARADPPAAGYCASTTSTVVWAVSVWPAPSVHVYVMV